MADLDWHADRSDLADLAQLDAPPPESIDERAVRAYRLGRVRAEMARRGIAACILSDPVNIRYATGTRNMQIFTSRNTPSRYALLTQDKCILHDFTGCGHLAEEIETITEIRAASTASFVASGEDIAGA
jgi:Xaa-Pro aminopeptidase